LLHRDPLDQIDRSPEHLLQRFFEVEEPGGTRLGTGGELDQQISIAAVGVKILLARGRAEDLQPPDVEAPAEFCQRLLLTAACMLGSGPQDGRGRSSASDIASFGL